jgi:hypothetical protein
MQNRRSEKESTSFGFTGVELRQKKSTIRPSLWPSQSAGMWQAGFFAAGSTGSQRSVTARRSHRVGRDIRRKQEYPQRPVPGVLQTPHRSVSDMGAPRLRVGAAVRVDDRRREPWSCRSSPEGEVSRGARRETAGAGEPVSGDLPTQTPHPLDRDSPPGSRVHEWQPI